MIISFVHIIISRGENFTRGRIRYVALNRQKSFQRVQIIIRTFNIYIFPLNHSYPFFLSLKIILLRYIFLSFIQVLRSRRIY